MNTRPTRFRAKIHVSAMILTLALAPFALNGQDSTLRSQLAALSQRFNELEQRCNLLILDVENLKTENARLRAAINASQSGDIQTRIDAAIASSSEVQWKRTQTHVQEQIDRMMQQITRRLDAVIDRRTTQAPTLVQPTQPTPTPVFSNDFPKEGVRYKVKPGDTLSSIAQRHGSTVRHIQNANKIADPNSLRAGDEIFIPVP